MDFNTLTIQFLKLIADIVGNWGVAIIILTLIVRALLWPANVSQQKSMKVMQTLQPKMKMIQEKYSSNPELMQKKMMEFYKENKFNPMAGCLPMLIQLPVFILLYSALISPQFIEQAGDANFLFIKRLDATIRSNAGLSGDGQFQLDGPASFMAAKNAIVYLEDGSVLDNVRVKDTSKAVSTQGAITPGEPVDMKFQLDNLDLNFATLNKVQKAEVKVSTPRTRETETIEFKRWGDVLAAEVPTLKAAETIHYDVIFLLILFIATMILTQKVMMTKNTTTDPQQQAIQKSMSTIMPVMISVTFIFVPIPAGVLLYLVTSNIFQIIQSVIINKQMEKEENKDAKDAVVDI